MYRVWHSQKLMAMRSSGTHVELVLQARVEGLICPEPRNPVSRPAQI